jgi:hypothetical protein
MERRKGILVVAVVTIGVFLFVPGIFYYSVYSPRPTANPTPAWSVYHSPVCLAENVLGLTVVRNPATGGMSLWLGCDPNIPNPV